MLEVCRPEKPLTTKKAYSAMNFKAYYALQIKDSHSFNRQFNIEQALAAIKNNRSVNL